MCIKMMYSIITFKNVFQYQMAEFNNAKPQLPLYQSNTYLCFNVGMLLYGNTL